MGGCQGIHDVSMARTDAEGTEECTHRVPRRKDGGNPGKFSGESPEGEEDRQDVVTLECQGPRS